MRKALILGSGGTGANVIKRIQELIEWRQNKPLEKFNNIQYLEIDTDPTSFEDSSYNFIHLGVSPTQASGFKKQITERGYHKWAEPDQIEAITNGAGATRMKGKFGFLYHYSEIETAVKARLKSMLSISPDTLDMESKSKTKIYVVANSVSGTGSGSFIDYGYLIKRVINSTEAFSDDSLLDVTLLLTLPASYEKKGRLRNSYYALEELNHYMSNNAYTIDHATNLGETISFKEGDLPFQHIYLIGPRGDGGEKILNYASLENSIGEYIYNDIFSSSADTRDARRDDMEKYSNIPDKLGYYPRYLSFGLSVIEYPALQITKASTYNFLRNSLNDWQKFDDSGANFHADKFLLKDGSYTNSGTIYSRLVATANVKIINGSTQVLNIISLLESVKQRAYSEFEENNNVKTLESLIPEINEGFVMDISGLSSGEYCKGIVYSAIEENKRSLESGDEDSWQIIVKRELLNIAFGQIGGLTAAIKILDIILTEKLPNLSEKIYEDSTAALHSQINEIVNNIVYVKNDILLKIGALRNQPVKRLLADYKRLVDEYIDAKINILAIDASKKLIENLGDELRDFKEKLLEFNSTIDAWGVELETLYNNIIKPQTINGHIIRNNEIEKISNGIMSKASVSSISFIQTELRKRFFNQLLNDEMMTQYLRTAKREIINNEKNRYIILVENKDVVNEFFAEHSNYEKGTGISGKIMEIFDDSKVFINLADSDPYSNPGDSDMRKKWCFYPDGRKITKSSEAANYPFADEVVNKLHIVDLDEGESQDSFDKYVIMFLQERASFPIRFIKTLKNEHMEEALSEIRENNEIKPSFISRIDEDFLPIDTNSIEELKASKLTFIIAVALGILVPSEDLFVTAAPSRGGKASLITAIAPVEITKVLKKAVYKLYKNEYMRSQLEAKIKKERANIGAAEFCEKLYNFLENPAAYGVILINPHKEKKDMIYLLSMDYIRTDPQLVKEWDASYSPDDEKLADFNVMRATFYGRVDASHPYKGFYCDICNAFICHSDKVTDLPTKCPNKGCGVV